MGDWQRAHDTDSVILTTKWTNGNLLGKGDVAASWDVLIG